MTTENKAVTALIRSMKKALASNHGIEVSHSALRASFLQAKGENPHAFSGKASEGRKDISVLHDLVREAPEFFAPQYDFDGRKLAWLKRAGLVPATSAPRTQSSRKLYLAADSVGCLERLSLDADGQWCLPEHFEFEQETVLLSQDAEIPSVKRYGLPDYLAKPQEFYAGFNLTLAPSYRGDFQDLGDDSGDSCALLVEMRPAEWERVVLAVLRENSEFLNEVEEWVGTHYQRHFESLSPAQRVDYVERYLEVLAQAAMPEIRFAWVHPDEDGDSCEASVDLETGEVTPSREVPDDIANQLVRTRIEIDGTELFPVSFRTGAEEGTGNWMLSKKNLVAVKKLLA